MTATHVAIAQAVAEELNRQEFSQAFQARREYIPSFAPGELEDLQIVVVPRQQRRTIKSRGLSDKEFDIDIGFLKRLRTTDPVPHADELMELVQEVIEHFEFLRLDSTPQATWFRAENNVPFSQSLMHEYNCFATAITLSYRVL